MQLLISLCADPVPNYELRSGWVDDYQVISSGPSVQGLMDAAGHPFMFMQEIRGKYESDRITIVEASRYPVREIALMGDTNPRNGRRIRGYTWWAMTDAIQQEFSLKE